MPRKRTLIPSPLAWRETNLPVAHPPVPVVAERGGTQLRTPLPVAVVDTREQNPLSFRRFKGWFAKIEYRALPLGDYSVKGMEETCVVERKDLADLIGSFTTIAVLTGLRLPFICTDTHELGEEIVASYLYQTFLYDWLDRNGHGRQLADGDL